MRVPKILYHGTTMLRWGFIKRNGLLRSDMSRGFKDLDCMGERGYVYLASDIDEAVIHGLDKSLLDMQILDIPENMKLNPNYRDPVVLGINAFKLGDVELDPQGQTEEIKQIRRTMEIKHVNADWYRYKGDIKLKHLRVYKHVPFDTFSSNQIDKLMKENERKLQKSQLLMKGLRSQSRMKQLFPLA